MNWSLSGMKPTEPDLSRSSSGSKTQRACGMFSVVPMEVTAQKSSREIHSPKLTSNPKTPSKKQTVNPTTSKRTKQTSG